MMHVRSIETAAAGRIARQRLDGVADKRTAADVAEQAFESFAVMLWQMALAQDNVSSWTRACEHLYTVRLFLDRMRLNHLAEYASDLMAVAGCHAEASDRNVAPMVGKNATQDAVRTRVF